MNRDEFADLLANHKMFATHCSCGYDALPDARNNRSNDYIGETLRAHVADAVLPLIEADLRERVAQEIEAAGRKETAWLADTAADLPGTVEMGRLIGTEDGYKAALRIVRGTDDE